MGASRLSRSSAASQARKAGARCGAAAAITTAASPGERVPTRWTMATSAPCSAPTASPISASFRSAMAW